MIGLFIFLLAFAYSFKSKSLKYFALFNFLVLLCILFFIYNNVEAAFQVSNKPSDTRLYYEGFTIDYSYIQNVLFYEYPLVLRWLVYPVKSALYAVFIQSNIIYFLLDLIIKNKKNLIFFITLHALLYTSTNLFKDNFIIIVALLAVFLLMHINIRILQFIIVGGSFLCMSWVRPFFRFVLPLAFVPYFTSVKEIKTKLVFLVLVSILSSVIIVKNWTLISYVINSWSSEASIQTEHSSFPVALVKIFLGPAPRHYLYHDIYFEQPLLDIQGYFFAFFNAVYYFFLVYICLYIVGNAKTVFNILFMSVSSAYSLFISIFLIIVYGLAYGSADIRQRAIILVFFYLFVLKDLDKPIFTPIRKKYLSLFFLLFYILLFITMCF